MNTDGMKEIMGNNIGRKTEKCFDIPSGKVKHLKVNKGCNKKSERNFKRYWKRSSWGGWVAAKPSK